jgi:SOS response regulatory protein OraA/RecX
MNFALSLAANRFPGITVGWAPEMDMSALDDDAPAMQVVPTPQTEEARLEQVLLPGGVSDATRAAALKQFEEQNGQNALMATPVAAPRRANRAPADAYEKEDQVLAGLLLGSPEFQRR